MAASERLEIRVQAELKKRLELAAELEHTSPSELLRSAMERLADQIIAAHDAATRLEPAFYDDLILSLGDDPEPNPVLQRAARRRARVVVTD